MHILIISLVSFVAAAMNSIAGGGTFLTFPALVGFGHLTEKLANMTSTVGLWPGSAASVVAARDDFRKLPRGMVLLYSAISLVGGTIGSLLLLHTTDAKFDLVVPWLLAFATTVFAFSKPIARWAGRQHGNRSLKWTLFVGCIQLLVATYGGYFGAGIGVLMLAGLSFAGLDDVHQMNAMKVLLATLINAVAACIFIHRGINWPIAGAMIAASIVGGFLGMVVARRVKTNQLRIVILTIGIVLTCHYFIRAYFPHEHEQTSHLPTLNPPSMISALPVTNDDSSAAR
jgi:uncharacterized membrane protein YfcA